MGEVQGRQGATPEGINLKHLYIHTLLRIENKERETMDILIASSQLSFCAIICVFLRVFIIQV
jgi:hypothetical protein